MDLFGKKQKAFKARYDKDRALFEKQVAQVDKIIKIGARNVELISRHLSLSKTHLELMLNVGCLSKREMMAINILNGLLASGEKGIHGTVARSYDYADELIKQSPEGE